MPSWKLVFEVRAISAMLGMVWTSPSPKMPAGRMAQVRSLGESWGAVCG